MKTPAALNTLLQKEMNRKEFLQHVATMALFVAGGGFLLQSFGNLGKLSDTSKSSNQGYGASTYGGRATNS